VYKVGDQVKTRTGIKNVHPKFKTAVLTVTQTYGESPSCAVVAHPDGETAVLGFEEVEAA